uniref:Uncharacterized protein n=1 Tax=uncultured prokaryote TaxID=198431 RepID=A0A0H5QN35_9ZZZZ|nr:hypothetical protein [uncultured prokaryote]
MRSSHARYLNVSLYRASHLHEALVTIQDLHKDGSEETVKHVIAIDAEVTDCDLETWAREVLAELIERI